MSCDMKIVVKPDSWHLQLNIRLKNVSLVTVMGIASLTITFTFRNIPVSSIDHNITAYLEPDNKQR